MSNVFGDNIIMDNRVARIEKSVVAMGICEKVIQH